MKSEMHSLLIIALFILSGCGKKEDSLCGAKTTWSSYVEDDFIYESLDPLTGRRTLIYEDLATPENICTDEHTTAKFGVEHSMTLPPGINMYGKAYWGGFNEEEVELQYEVPFYTGTIKDIGLKQAFGTDPGWIGLQIKFEFPTQGSLNNDKAYVDSLIDKMYISYEFYEDL